MPYRFVEANGIRMNVAEQGKGPLVLLCHGFPETSHSWRHQLASLADAGFRAVAPDMRGYGKTDSPIETDQYTVFHLVGDMVGLLDALEVETATIVGNDWGATIAWQAALMRPDRFRGVVALGVPMMGQSPMPPTQIFPQTSHALLYALYFQAPGTAEAEFERDVLTTMRKLLFGASGEAGPRRENDGTPNPFGMVSRCDGLLAPLPNPARLPIWLSKADLEIFATAFAESGFRGGLNYYRNLDRNWRLQAALNGKTVDIPALYIVGERDVGLSIPGMRELIAAMPGLVPMLKEPIFLPGCGHWAPQERPQQVSTAIIDFARSL
ncbi:alpha/beta hydrolase [Bradyrhizobium sp. KBS0727]|uniref:alpha/beta fold hydrolase n=1 Tax=unclassified Bradyrhizobium TaxID=2631580 RepID=UPI00110E26C4|nr:MULTISPECIES: alpha/beta hydrolase [unclassified Bradyrhizobium]QDW35964.1 alpha/beta hydrolase [Bradyrhizobium sp. KBS0725]QDW42564.1 alpha/beta hydrolase [Bradyrhizobium sp. KBS0727]